MNIDRLLDAPYWHEVSNRVDEYFGEMKEKPVSFFGKNPCNVSWVLLSVFINRFPERELNKPEISKEDFKTE